MIRIFRRKYSKYSSIQMMNEKLRQHLFGRQVTDTANFEIQSERKENDNLENLTLPGIINNNINEHFQEIASSQIKDYLKIVHSFKSIPQVPKIFMFQPGWTK